MLLLCFVDLSPQHVQLIVNNAMKLYSEDRTGLVDYALESGGIVMMLTMDGFQIVFKSFSRIVELYNMELEIGKPTYYVIGAGQW